tara:strand:- start:1051 stop:1287 length:237 start_codon:yes stop_codon:yes gene_type:complete
MKTLYNSIKPEYKDKLDAHAKDYPATIESIKKSLYYNELWSRLTVSQVRDFVSFTDTPLGSLSFEDWAFGDRFLIKEK